MLLITGGAGFIGANFMLDWLPVANEAVLNVDKLTYAGSGATLRLLQHALQHHPGHIFVQADICDRAALDQLLYQYKPRAIIHFAAESHVDRSIQKPADYIHTNIFGTFTLLEAVRAYWHCLDRTDDQEAFRFLHISTDEVYGSLAAHDPPFCEQAPYAPNNPYAASKASADHLVRAYHHTYGLPTLTIHCSNNYGPYQFPDKLVPRIIANALAGRPLPIYGDGQQVRDWLYVRDHCLAIRTVLARGRVGETYNIGGGNQKTNLELVKALCRLLDYRCPKASGSYEAQIELVEDRGHDRHYAINASKIRQTLGWRPLETFDSGLKKTVQWYLDHLSIYLNENHVNGPNRPTGLGACA